MKGSAGWVVIGVVSIFILFVMVRAFYQDAFGYKLKHQNIVFGELEILRTKNTLLLAEKSLDATWNLSVLQLIFDSGQKGFGSEFWYKTSPADKSQLGKAPSNDEIKGYLENRLANDYKPRGYDESEDIGGIWLRIETISPIFTLENEKITSAVSNKIKTFAGGERKPTTQAAKISNYEHSFLIQFKKLTDAGKLFVQVPFDFATQIPGYNSNGNAYKAQLENSLTNLVNNIPVDLDKQLTIEKAEFIVPSLNEDGVLSPLSGLLFHYIMKGQFSEKQALYNYLDEVQNRFEKKPFSLAVKAEDYNIALNCAENNGLFTFSSPNDMTCSNGKIYTCNTPVEGIGDNMLTCVSGIGKRIGNFGCGENGFKTAAAAGESSCYCTAFGGNWASGKCSI